VGTSRASAKKGGVPVDALRDVDLRIERGEFVAIIGPSGSGKSTLLHILGFLDRPSSGSYTFQGQRVDELSDDELALLRNRYVGFVFQQFHLLPRATATENAMLPLVYGGRGHDKEEAVRRIGDVSLQHRQSHTPREMSGGEQQRVAIARALVNDPLLVLADEPTGNLDSRSEEEIVRILDELNRAGKTVIIVTHEEPIARHARRIIHMKDGRIVSDEKQGQPAAGGPVASEAGGTAPDVENVLKAGQRRGGRARFGDHVRQAFRAMGSHKMRSALSMLGILIGVGAVIAMLAVTQGARQQLEEQLSKLGRNLLMVRAGSRRLRGVHLESGPTPRFTMADAEAVGELPLIKYMSPGVYGRVQVVRGNRNWNTSVLGAGIMYPLMRSAVPVQGRFFTQEEVDRREKVVVLGTTVVRELFGEQNPIGAAVKLNRVNFTVIGVQPTRGGSHWRDWDDVVLMPVTTAMYRLLGRRYISSVDVEVVDASLMEQAKEEIRALLARRLNISADLDKHVSIRDMTEIQEMIGATTETMGWLLGSIAAISLVVGGIGIMNIMLVSVTERTREIGLRKALGARRKDVMTQFLVESIAMTVSGGLAGIALGMVIAATLSKFAEWPVTISAWAILLAALFSVSVGLMFGLWPARQAARLDPIEALRYE